MEAIDISVIDIKQLLPSSKSELLTSGIITKR